MGRIGRIGWFAGWVLVAACSDPREPAPEVGCGADAAGVHAFTICSVAPDGVETCAPTGTVPALHFGDVNLWTSATRTLRIRNTGPGALRLCGGVAPASAGFVVSAAQVDVAAGSVAEVRVEFTANGAGPALAALQWKTNDDARPTLAIPLRAQPSCAPPEEGLHAFTICAKAPDGSETCARPRDPPPTLDFGTVKTGEATTRTLTIRNDLPAPLRLCGGGALETEGFVAEPYAAMLGEGESANVKVTYTGTGNAPAVQGTLRVRTNDHLRPEVPVPLKADVELSRICLVPEQGLGFGYVQVNTPRTRVLTFQNCDQAPLMIRSMAIVGDESGARFSLGDVPAASGSAPFVLQPGETLHPSVTYRPIARTTGGHEDRAVLMIDLPHRQIDVPLMGQWGELSCLALPGPTASIHVLEGTQDVTADPVVPPGEALWLDGSQSHVSPTNGHPTYVWRLVSQPPEGLSALSVSNGRARLFTTLAGDYVVELIVRDSFECESAPVQVTIHARPEARVYVQLTWAEGFGDVDLHYLGPGGAYGDPQADANADNESPDWGLDGTTAADGNPANDPKYRVDVAWGHGPEVVAHPQPEPGTYTVVATYPCARAFVGRHYEDTSRGPANVRVSVFVDGEKALETARRLTQRDSWTVATLQVKPNGEIVVTPATEAPTKLRGIGDGCTTAVD